MAEAPLDFRHEGWGGSGLARPESVIATGDGDLFVSNAAAVATHITADGRQKAIGIPPSGSTFIPNGLGLLRDGTLLVANMGQDGGVWSLGLSEERLEPLLTEADGVRLHSANFVLADPDDGVWITVSTRTVPANSVYNTDVADGFIVRRDGRGARIVADGLRFANECRVAPDGNALYVAETAGARVSRFRIGEGGRLGARETFCQFPADVFPEGLAFDAEGHLWLTSVISNRILRIDRNGGYEVAFSDTDDAHLQAVREARLGRALARAHFYGGAGKVLAAPSSLCFFGPGLDRIAVGSLVSPRLALFRSSVRGLPPVHWHYRRPF